MQVNLPAGKYVVAVSGGVDSVVLLHVLVQKQSDSQIVRLSDSQAAGEPDSKTIRLSDNKTIRLVVAHYDHGIREDSAEDRKLVQELAAEYGLPFEYAEGKLGAAASEAVAREARYAFLRQVREKYGADAILTAHHQDDVLETAILNLLRGLSRRGFASLRSTDEIKRPLLNAPKEELLRYAEREGLRWREDSTNTDPKYLRNYVRLKILPRFAEADREALLGLVQRMAQVNGELDKELDEYLRAHSLSSQRRLGSSQKVSAEGAQNRLDSCLRGNDGSVGMLSGTLDRHAFVLLRHVEAREVMAYWLRTQTGTELSRRLLERLVTAAKTGRSGTKVDVDGKYWLSMSGDVLTLVVK